MMSTNSFLILLIKPMCHVPRCCLWVLWPGSFARGRDAEASAQGGVERFARWREVERARGRRRVVGEGVAGVAVVAVDGFHALAQWGLLAAEAHEVQPDGAVVERVGGGAPHHLTALGRALVSCLALAQL